MRALGLRKSSVGLLFDGVDHVGELDRVLDEEDGNVVTDEVPIALLGVKLDGESADVACEVERSLVSGNCREADEGRRLFSRALKQVSLGVGRCDS